MQHVAVLAVLLTVAAAVTIHAVFRLNPHLVDEMAQLFHARVFASGRLAAWSTVALLVARKEYA